MKVFTCEHDFSKSVNLSQPTWFVTEFDRGRYGVKFKDMFKRISEIYTAPGSFYVRCDEPMRINLKSIGSDDARVVIDFEKNRLGAIDASGEKFCGDLLLNFLAPVSALGFGVVSKGDLEIRLFAENDAVGPFAGRTRVNINETGSSYIGIVSELPFWSMIIGGIPNWGVSPLTMKGILSI